MGWMILNEEPEDIPRDGHVRVEAVEIVQGLNSLPHDKQGSR